MKNVTIKEVAKAVGVSPSTVSRVINDSKRISDETKKNVRKAMKELGYHQNAVARSLVTQKSNTIALVMARSTQKAFANPFFSGVIQGISNITQKSYFNLLLSSTEDYHQEQEESLKLMRNRKVDGLILLGSRVNDELINQLLEYNFPFVLIGRSPEHSGIPIVNNDNIKAANDTVNYLVNKGYKKILALSGPEEYIVSQDRASGYRKAMQEFDYTQYSKIVSTSDFTYEDGYEATIQLLNEDYFDAIFAFDDMLAIGALRAIQSFGLRVPADKAVIGFNDDPMVSYLKPALTTVKLPIKKMGEEAAKMLIKIIKEKDYKGEEIILSTELLIRDSV